MPEAVVQSWDPAVVPGNSNDFSVCTTWGLIGNNIDLLDVHRQRHGMPELERAAINLRATWQPELIIVEGSHTGRGLIQMLEGRGFRGIRGYGPKVTKAERMAILTPMLEAGQVRLPPAAIWLEVFLEECGQFPNGKYDDQVDTLSQMLFAVRKGVGELWHLSRYRKK
jgi:predicted phage terminase large subunit-like protein